MPSKTTSNMRPKRRCKICSKTLANLNPNKDLCFAHDQRYPQYEHLPVTRCTSFKRGVSEKHHELDGIAPLPGTEKYNDIAFVLELIYPDFN